MCYVASDDVRFWLTLCNVITVYACRPRVGHLKLMNKPMIPQNGGLTKHHTSPRCAPICTQFRSLHHSHARHLTYKTHSQGTTLPIHHSPTPSRFDPRQQHPTPSPTPSRSNPRQQHPPPSSVDDHAHPSLDLLGAPAGVRLAHVGWGLDGWDELEGDVADADDADDGAGNDAEDAVVEQDAADKDVDCVRAKRRGGVS